MCKTLEETRKNIDKIDNEIVKLIAERTKYVKKAAEFKKDDNDVKAPDRVRKVISKVKELGIKYGVDEKLIENLYTQMINSFINIEMEEVNKTENL